MAVHLDETPQHVQLLIQRAFHVELAKSFRQDKVVRVFADHLRLHENRLWAQDETGELFGGAWLGGGEEQSLAIGWYESQDAIELILETAEKSE